MNDEERQQQVAERKRAAARVKAYEAGMPKIAIHRGGQVVRLATPSSITLWRALSYFDKEPETIAWIAGMPEGAVLFDVGANIGLYTVWAGLTRNAQVFAFEPESSNYGTLNVNLQLNGLTGRCRAFCAGVSDRTGFDALRIARSGVGASGHQVDSTVGPTFAMDEVATQGIVTTTLDHLVYEAGLPCPSHLKIDVDGIEPAIIAGGTRLLADSRLRSVLIELAVWHADHRAVIDRLVAAGFDKDVALEKAVYAKDSGVKYTGNIIFTRR